MLVSHTDPQNRQCLVYNHQFLALNHESLVENCCNLLSPIQLPIANVKQIILIKK